MYDFICPFNPETDYFDYSEHLVPLQFAADQTNCHLDLSSSLLPYSDSTEFFVGFSQEPGAPLDFMLSEKFDDLILYTPESGHHVIYRGTQEQMHSLLSDTDFHINFDPKGSVGPDLSEGIYMFVQPVTPEECISMGRGNIFKYQVEL